MWNYRLVEVGDEVGIYHVYHDEDGSPKFRSTDTAIMMWHKDKDSLVIQGDIMDAFLNATLTDEDFIGKVF